MKATTVGLSLRMALGLRAVLLGALVLGIAWAGCGQALAEEEVAQVVPFRAFSLDGTTLLFTGEYRLTRLGSVVREVQEYRTLQGRPAQRIESEFDEGSQQSLLYANTNLRTGESVRLAVQGNKLTYEVRDAKGQVSASGSGDASGHPYFWTGLPHLVASRWEQVTAGKSNKVPLYVLSLKSDVEVQLQPLQPRVLAGTSAEEFQIQPTSWLVRKLADPVHLFLASAPPHQVLEVDGRSAVANDKGSYYDLKIIMDWPASGIAATQR